MDQEMTHKLYVMSSLSEMNPYKTPTNLVVTHFKFIKMYHNLQQQQKKVTSHNKCSHAVLYICFLL